MIQDVHSKKESLSVTTTTSGDNIIVPAVADAWIYIHELIGDLDTADTLKVKCGTRIVGTFDLSAGQGFTESDEPGEDNRPRFECRPGENFILNITGSAIFKGSVHYSLRY